jgi:hypothetical protein
MNCPPVSLTPLSGARVSSNISCAGFFSLHEEPASVLGRVERQHRHLLIQEREKEKKKEEGGGLRRWEGVGFVCRCLEPVVESVWLDATSTEK